MSNSKTEVRDVWANPATLATPLFVLWCDRFVVDSDAEPDDENHPLRWDPETVVTEIETEFQVRLPRLTVDRLLTAREIVTTDRFFTRLRDFIDACNVLYGSATFDPNEFDPADSFECAWGITEALLLSPPDDEDSDHVFSDQIVGYVGAAVERDGIVRPPDVLRIGDSVDRSEQIRRAWSDRPELLALIWEEDRKRGEAVSRMVRAGLRNLVDQLDGLPLVNGDTSGIVEKLLRVVPRTTQQSGVT